MKNLKINLDRPTVDSKTIQSNKDFSGLMKNHAMMSKPFYKSTWFMGSAGIASIGVIVGGLVVLQDNPEQLNDSLITDSQAPPDLVVPESKLISMNTDYWQGGIDINKVKETLAYSDYLKQIDDNNSTLENSNNTQDEESLSNSNSETISSDQLDISQDLSITKQANNQSSMFLEPRISGKINGAISKNELFDNKGITTESDVSVIHFELHLIDGLGGKVFEEESNQLNAEMKAALKKIHTGETIYFENIKGKTSGGDIVRLNPMRYVLMN